MSFLLFSPVFFKKSFAVFNCRIYLILFHIMLFLEIIKSLLILELHTACSISFGYHTWACYLDAWFGPTWFSKLSHCNHLRSCCWTNISLTFGSFRCFHRMFMLVCSSLLRFKTLKSFSLIFWLNIQTSRNKIVWCSWWKRMRSQQVNVLNLIQFFHLFHWSSVRDFPLVCIAKLTWKVWLMKSGKQIQSVKTVA